MKRLNEKNQVIGVAGIGLLTILALFPPAAALPGFSVTATSGGELALSTGGILANGAIASVAGTISIAGIAGNGSGDGEGASEANEKVGENSEENNSSQEKPENPKKVNDSYLKQKGIDAHSVKNDYLGKKAPISRYDLYVDKVTGRIWIYLKGGKGVPIRTDIYIK